MSPGYLELNETGELKDRVEKALDQLKSCRACLSEFDINRLENKKKIYRTGRYTLVASCFDHFGEEDCLRGRRGSGTIFFAWCNLRCVFC